MFLKKKKKNLRNETQLKSSWGLNVVEDEEKYVGKVLFE